ncbi:MAG: helix-turn-helix domain-containing protein [Lachnospiraceae bacterium]|nr:helix-turn-helix domain-containing protein [Lachnospiraceae bacterium]
MTLFPVKAAFILYNALVIYLKRLKELRQDKLLKQKDIADQIFVSQRTYSDYETGRVRMPVESMVRLARYYDVSVDYISGASNIKTPFPSE